jgi:hypothetical protein
VTGVRLYFRRSGTVCSRLLRKVLRGVLAKEDDSLMDEVDQDAHLVPATPPRLGELDDRNELERAIDDVIDNGEGSRLTGTRAASSSRAVDTAPCLRSFCST